MNEKGQLLLVDAILSIILLFIVIAAILYVVGDEEDTFNDYSIAQENINLLARMNVHGENLLLALSDGDSTANATAGQVLSPYSYTLKDLTLNKTVSQVYAEKYRDVFRARKVLENHEYELAIYI